MGCRRAVEGTSPSPLGYSSWQKARLVIVDSQATRINPSSPSASPLGRPRSETPGPFRGPPSRRSPHLIVRHDCVVEADVSEAVMAVDAGVGERRVLVAAEGEDGLVHLLSVEDLEPYEQVEVFDGE